MELDLVRATDVEHHLREHLLREVHQIVVVRVGPVELAGGELRIVRHVHAFIAEETADLIHPLETAHDKHLQVELGRDAHVQVAVELIVVSDERLGRRAASDHVHHRRLHLKEAAHVEEAPDEVDDLAARAEDVACAAVEDEVQIALAVARLLVGKAIRRLGHHVQARREQLHLRGEDGQLATLGLPGHALHAHDVATLDRVGQLHEGSQPLAVRHRRELGELARVSKHLQLEPVGAEVIEDEAFASGADVGDSPRHRLLRRGLR
mmetsp:Transcript_16483/g.34816  ORF Transcript_16483/g.34816 Transcript_16483/m.34816 type:complete len:265 (-) Transcript_16483:433-1227(-)